MSIKEQIRKEINDHRVMLYMKGDKDFPMCGFSGQVVHILNSIGIHYETRNVLENNQLRQGIKEFSNWPTIPQLYVGGEFLGGCDITTELYQSGELQRILAAKNGAS